MPEAMMLNISMRTAEVLLDEYKVFFQDRIGVEGYDIGETSTRKTIRKQLGCRPFSWYVENVYRTLFIPAQSLATGEVRNPWSAFCIESGVTSDHFNQPVKLFPCNNMGGHQYWMFSKMGEIRQVIILANRT
jgi:polypeptide N-acetylgalactosaminyltransferase